MAEVVGAQASMTPFRTGADIVAVMRRAFTAALLEAQGAGAAGGGDMATRVTLQHLRAAVATL